MLAHGSNGRREAGGKRALGSPALKTADRQTNNHPDCLSVTDSPPPPKAPFQRSPRSFGHTPSRHRGVRLPPIPKELALQRGAAVVVFLPEALGLGAPAQVPRPPLGDERGPGCSRAREVSSGTASPLPHPGIRACLVLAVLPDDVPSGGRYAVPLRPWGGGEGTLLGLLSGGRGEGSRV